MGIESKLKKFLDLKKSKKKKKKKAKRRTPPRKANGEFRRRR